MRNKKYIRRANPCDPALKPLNHEITSDISLHKQNLWKEHLNANWDHRHNTHTLLKTIHGLSNRAAPTPQNCTITFNKKIATSPKNIVNCFNKQFKNTVKHNTHKTNRSIIDRAVHKLPKHTITLTTTQVQEAIQHSKNNNSVGPDNLSIRHLKHIGSLGITFLTSMYTTALNKNIIPHMWKLVLGKKGTEKRAQEKRAQMEKLFLFVNYCYYYVYYSITCITLFVVQFT